MPSENNKEYGTIDDSNLHNLNGINNPANNDTNLANNNTNNNNNNNSDHEKNDEILDKNALPAAAKITKKNRLNNSLFKSFTNFFKETQSTNDLNLLLKKDAEARLSCISLNQQISQSTNNTSLLLPISDPLQQSHASVVKSSGVLYSLQNLPYQAQCLLNAQHDFDELNNEKAAFECNTREVQLYLSTPYASSSSPAASSFKNKLVDLVFYSNTHKSVYKLLQSYCGQPTNNCDLNLIDLNYFNESLENNQVIKKLMVIISSIIIR